MTTRSLREQVISMTNSKLTAVINNVYKETLRALLNILGETYYIDGNSNRVKLKCSHGNPERIAGRLKSDNTLILPMLSIVETETVNSDSRRRSSPLLRNESYWDPEKRRAVRILSLVPRPINISYYVNIWSKYKADMDMIRSSIFSLFNPDVTIKTQYSDVSVAFLESETDIGSMTVGDTNDRILQKALKVTVETYIPSPKFMITSTGEIHEFNGEVQFLDRNDNILNSSPINSKF